MLAYCDVIGSLKVLPNLWPPDLRWALLMSPPFAYIYYILWGGEDVFLDSYSMAMWKEIRARFAGVIGQVKGSGWDDHCGEEGWMGKDGPDGGV